MSRKQKIIVSIVGISLVTLIIVGLTYGYYLTQINGNTNDKSISVNLANLELTYDDGNGLIEAKNIIPGQTIATKTFTVKNTGNKKISNYAVYLDDVVNTFEDKSDLKLTLSCTSDTGNCNGTTITYPSNNTLLITNDIEEKELQSYELKVEFLETNDDQSDNMNKEMSGNIIINDLKGLNNTIDNVTGTEDIEVDNAQLLSNYRIYGNSVQEGTPSPTNPVEIESVGDLITDTADVNYGKYKIPIKVTGKNLWTTNYSFPLYRFDKAAVEYDDKTQMYTINQSSGNISTSIYELPKEIPTGTKITIYMYIIQGNTSGTITFGGYHNGTEGRSWQGAINLSQYANQDLSGKVIKQTFTTTNSVTDFWVFLYYDYTINTQLKFKMMYIIGEDSNEEYEPYQEETTNIYLDEPLRKIGDYSDYIDFKSGTVVRNIKRLDFKEASTKYTWLNKNGIYFKDNLFEKTTLAKGMSNRETGFTQSSQLSSSMWIGVNKEVIVYWVGITDVLNIYDESKTTQEIVTEFNEWLSNNPTYIIYQISNQQTEQVSLPQINLNSTKSYISINTSTSPSNVEFEIIK